MGKKAVISYPVLSTILKKGMLKKRERNDTSSIKRKSNFVAWYSHINNLMFSVLCCYLVTDVQHGRRFLLKAPRCYVKCRGQGLSSPESFKFWCWIVGWLHFQYTRVNHIIYTRIRLQNNSTTVLFIYRIRSLVGSTPPVGPIKLFLVPASVTKVVICSILSVGWCI